MGLLNESEKIYYANSTGIWGGYQFVSLSDIINQFMIVYVGEDKIISKASRTDVAFHAQRALAELSFDTFKSTKAFEVTVPNTMTLKLPQDYVNYVKISSVDGSGIKHILYPTSKTSNPINPSQNDEGSYLYVSTTGDIQHGINVNNPIDSDTWDNYKSLTPSENSNDDYEDDTHWPMLGGRHGLDPQHSQANGSFYIDNIRGKIHFSSNLSGKTVILDYISDSLGTDTEMKVHKFAEEAMYKSISYAILAAKSNIPEYQINRFKKERFAETRKAKLRLSNIKLEEITQILRGKSKQIKH
mgnify:FL=1|tara:strand:+ start:853 stop:1752 length:900 start_codon:yes stop_codon:yes gene_type:complete